MMVNPLPAPSGLPFGAPVFDKVRREHYIPAFKEAVAASMAGMDAIVSCPEGVPRPRPAACALLEKLGIVPAGGSIA